HGACTNHNIRASSGQSNGELPAETHASTTGSGNDSDLAIKTKQILKIGTIFHFEILLRKFHRIDCCMGTVTYIAKHMPKNHKTKKLLISPVKRRSKVFTQKI